MSLQQFDENKKEAQTMMGVVQNLFATLGPTMAIDVKLEAPTLWGTTALERVFGTDMENSHMKTLESRKKLNIKTGSEAAAATALSYPRPCQFHNGKVSMTTERIASRLSKLPNYKSWNSRGQGPSEGAFC